MMAHNHIIDINSHSNGTHPMSAQGEPLHSHDMASIDQSALLHQHISLGNKLDLNAAEALTLVDMTLHDMAKHLQSMADQLVHSAQQLKKIMRRLHTPHELGYRTHIATMVQRVKLDMVRSIRQILPQLEEETITLAGLSRCFEPSLAPVMTPHPQAHKRFLYLIMESDMPSATQESEAARIMLEQLHRLRGRMKARDAFSALSMASDMLCQMLQQQMQAIRADQNDMNAADALLAVHHANASLGHSIRQILHQASEDLV